MENKWLKKRWLKKKWVGVSVVSVLLLGMTACAETPDSNIVAQKNHERLREEAQQTPDAENTLQGAAEKAPAHYDYLYQNGEQTLTVTADADVWLPEKDVIPMYEMTGAPFSQDMVTRVYDYFFEGQETYTLEGTDVTKEVVAEELLNLKALLEQEKAVTDSKAKWTEDDIQNLEEMIADMEEEYKTAPEESTLHKVPVDSTIHVLDDMQSSDNRKYEGVNCHSDTAYFFVLNAPADASSWTTMKYYGDSRYNYSGQEGEQLLTEEDKRKAGEAIGISYEDAKKIADDFFHTIGIEAEECASFQTTGWLDVEEEATDKWLYENDTDVAQYPDQPTAYRFIYARLIDGIPIAATSSSTVPHDTTSIIWCYENLELFVEPQGIVDFSWEFPTEVMDTVSENVGILSFEEAAEIFETMMPIQYEGELEEMEDNTEDFQCSYEITVNRVELSLMRVRDSGGERTGLFTPTWVFYGTEVHNYHAYSEYSGQWEDWSNVESAPWIVLAVNAVDGSVIDIVEGY